MEKKILRILLILINSAQAEEIKGFKDQLKMCACNPAELKAHMNRKPYKSTIAFFCGGPDKEVTHINRWSCHEKHEESEGCRGIWLNDSKNTGVRLIDKKTSRCKISERKYLHCETEYRCGKK